MLITFIYDSKDLIEDEEADGLKSWTAADGLKMETTEQAYNK
jgi:hypothetical protein